MHSSVPALAPPVTAPSPEDEQIMGRQVQAQGLGQGPRPSPPASVSSVALVSGFILMMAISFLFVAGIIGRNSVPSEKSTWDAVAEFERHSKGAQAQLSDSHINGVSTADASYGPTGSRPSGEDGESASGKKEQGTGVEHVAASAGLAEGKQGNWRSKGTGGWEQGRRGRADAPTPFYVPITVLEDSEFEPGVCLDGSPPAYHFSPGWGDGETKWVVYLEGGGWCTDGPDCRKRARTRLGSSRRMGQSMPLEGILSNDSRWNPLFYNWNAVFVRYCDGSSFSGTAMERKAKDGVTVAGQWVFERVVRHLMDMRGMRDATHALLAGCSAGGLAAALHCDEFSQMLRGGSKGRRQDVHTAGGVEEGSEEAAQAGPGADSENTSKSDEGADAEGAEDRASPTRSSAEAEASLGSDSEPGQGYGVQGGLGGHRGHGGHRGRRRRLKAEDGALPENRRLHDLVSESWAVRSGEGAVEGAVNDEQAEEGEGKGEEDEEQENVEEDMSMDSTDKSMEEKRTRRFSDVLDMRKGKVSMGGEKQIEGTNGVSVEEDRVLEASGGDSPVADKDLTPAAPYGHGAMVEGHGAMTRGHDGTAGSDRYGPVVKCLSDAGYFPDVKDVTGGRRLWEMFTAVVTFHHPQMPSTCTDSADEAAAGGGAQESLKNDPTCFFAHNALQTTSTPYFLLSPLYDLWLIRHGFIPEEKEMPEEWVPCRKDLRRCSFEQMSKLHTYRKQIVRRVSRLVRGKGRAAFLDSCRTHCQGMHGLRWHGPGAPRVNNRTMAEAVGAWFEGREEPWLADCEYPCNLSCYPNALTY